MEVDSQKNSCYFLGMQLELQLGDLPPATVEVEEWKECAGFPAYEISSFARMRRKDNGKYLTGALAANGYRHIGPMDASGKQRFKLLHRLMAATFLVQPSPQHEVVNHKNHRRDDNRLSNLEWATRSYNAKHAKEKRF